MKNMKNFFETVFRSIRKWINVTNKSHKMTPSMATGRRVEKAVLKATEGLVAMRRFLPIGQRELNSFCIAAWKEGLDCWDRVISRYIYSGSVDEYHPFRLSIMLASC